MYSFEQERNLFSCFETEILGLTGRKISPTLNKELSIGTFKLLLITMIYKQQNKFRQILSGVSTVELVLPILL